MNYKSRLFFYKSMLLFYKSDTNLMVTNYEEGGYKTGRGGGLHVKFYPYEKGEQNKF